MQIKSFKDLADALRTPVARHKRSVPATVRTPEPQKNKVVAVPTRTPINKQSALLISPIRCWLSKPLPPEKLPNPHQEELDRLKAELKAERNDHALTSDALGISRERIRELNLQMDKQNQIIKSLKAQVASRDETIRQLEDLRL